MRRILREAVAPTDLLPDLETEGGFIRVDRRMATNLEGVFAAGDVREKTVRQIVTAAADGAIAACSAERYTKSVSQFD